MDDRGRYLFITTAIGVCSLAVLYWKLQSQAQEELLPDEAKVDLLPIEKTLAAGGGGDNAMATLTWFNGEFTKVSALLKERAESILKANSWLAGRVRKHRGEDALVYPRTARVADYITVSLKLLSRDTPLNELGAQLADDFLKTGPAEPLWKVTVYPSSTSATHFAVVVCMSHVIGDGATFFKIQNMLLNQTIPVESLEVSRILTTEDQQIKALGGKEEYKVLSSPGFIANCVVGVLRTALKKEKYSASSRIFLVDEGGMKKAKKDAVANAKDISFVSSNDVLTSWFLQNCNCKHGFMALNFRGRLEGHTEHHTGNYENVIFYRKEDSMSPALIRRSISNEVYIRQVTTQQPMPSFYEMATSTNAICTNWASFAKPCRLEGCNEEIQIPLYNLSAMLPSTMAICLIFQAGPKGLAVFVAGSEDKLGGLAKSVAFLKQNETVN